MTQTLDTFQEEIIEFGNWRGRIIYADPMGARKTATTLSWLRQRESAERILFVVPGAVVDHWISQGERWYPELLMFNGTGSAVKRATVLQIAADIPAGYVTTYDSMKADEDSLIAAGFDTVIFDEGHRLKGRTTAVAKSAYRVTRKVTNIWCVTGTPILNAPEEMWFYLHLLFSKTFPSFWKWVEEHFIVQLKHFGRGGQPVKVIGDYIPGHAERVRKQLRSVLIQRELSDLYDEDEHPWIVEPVFHPQHIEITVEERKYYDKIVKHSWAQFPSGKLVTAKNKLVVSTRLKQLASDWGTVDPTLAYGSKVSAAAGLIRELLDEGPVVVFTEYVETAERLARLLVGLGIGAETYSGRKSDAEKAHIKGLFQNGMLPVIVGTYGSMREGVDGLQHASHQMVLVDLLWVPGLVDQAVGRLRRDGQMQRVHVHLLAAMNTVDMTVLRANLRKVNVVNTLKGQPLHDIVYGINFDIEVIDED